MQIVLQMYKLYAYILLIKWLLFLIQICTYIGTCCLSPKLYIWMYLCCVRMSNNCTNTHNNKQIIYKSIAYTLHFFLFILYFIYLYSCKLGVKILLILLSTIDCMDCRHSHIHTMILQLSSLSSPFVLSLFLYFFLSFCV